MAYIIENDVRVLLPVRDINILLEKNNVTETESEAFLTQRVLFAIDFVKSYIQHRYDVSQIFIDVNTFDSTATYTEGSAIYWFETAYDNSVDYSAGDFVSYEGNIYEVTTETPSAGILPTDTNYWTKRGANKRYYTVIQDTIAGAYPYNTSYFTQADARHQLILTYTLSIAVYELFKKVQPTQVPDWIISSRDEAVSHLKDIQRGISTVILPVKTDADGIEEGHEITYDFPYTNQNYDF